MLALRFAIVFVAIAVKCFALRCAWDWYAMPYAGLPYVSTAILYGGSVAVNVLGFGGGTAGVLSDAVIRENMEDGKEVAISAALALLPLLAVLVMWIAKSFA